jgi:glycosyltransferase involved in cell wall biosynthesis
MKVVIFGTQPIDPAVGCGQLRLLGLHYGLGEAIEATYIGSCDRPGQAFRRHRLSPTLEEINIPLSAAHYHAAEERSRQVGGRVVIDAAFHEQARLSPEYVEAAREAARAADAAIFSHPWVYPLVLDILDPRRQLIIYESHGVEGVLRMQLLGDLPVGYGIARSVAALECELCSAADLVLACAQEDRLQFARTYEIAPDKIKLVPNGAFTSRLQPASLSERSAARFVQELPDRPTAIFIGNDLAPNVEAATFVAHELAPQLPDVQFLIAGGAGDKLMSAQGTPRLANVRVIGHADDSTKRTLLAASDVGLNPMFRGSGSDIQMFEFMASGLPVITTPSGARAITTSCPALMVRQAIDFPDGLRVLLQSTEERAALGEAARAEAERHFSWERISSNLGAMLRNHFKGKITKQPDPFFSVVVPSFERPVLLSRLMDRLAMQSWRDFEVIIIDQSAEPWPDRDRDFGLSVCYLPTDARGAANARNFGVHLSRGHIIAFTNDDCEPPPRWLQAARPAFDDPRTIGLEGLIESDHLHDPAWQAFSNEGFRGIASMTANLFVRAEIFNELNGFDTEFDQQFREDMDFGWRAKKLGRIPFSAQAWVFRPSHSRDIHRESNSVSAVFFEKDALLMKRHPERYRELFFAESHWRRTEGFWPNFLRGARKYGVDVPDWIRELAPADQAPQIPLSRSRFHGLLS